jgi:hypothetical protein
MIFLPKIVKLVGSFFGICIKRLVADAVRDVLGDSFYINVVCRYRGAGRGKKKNGYDKCAHIGFIPF